MRSLLLVIVCVLVPGCSSPWQTHYRSVRQLEGVSFAERDTARIFEVEWERLSAYERAARQRAVERDERPDQLDPATSRAELQTLLDTLRVDAPPERVIVLGGSRFVSTTLLDPYSDDVRTLASSVGGDVAVVSIEPLGLRETVEYATRTEFFERDVYRRRGDRFEGRETFRVDERVPVVVPRETWGYTLIVLRVDKAGVVRELTGGRPWLP